MPENDCLFCRIIAGEIPADLVHQDESCIVIRDLNPQAPTHVLIIPREHMESLDDASHRDEPLLGHLLRVAARTANDEGLAEGGYRAVIKLFVSLKPIKIVAVYTLEGVPLLEDTKEITAGQKASRFETVCNSTFGSRRIFCFLVESQTQL